MNPRAARILCGVLAAGGVTAGGAIGTTLWSIQHSVRDFTRVARQAHPQAGDDVAALVQFMSSTEHSLPERNLAVWTLGRLRAPEARDALDSAYTGEPCDHDRALCQRELAKAVARCR